MKKITTPEQYTEAAKWLVLQNQNLKSLTAQVSALKESMAEYVDTVLPLAAKKAQEALARGDREGVEAALAPVPSVDGISTQNHVSVSVVDVAQVPASYWSNQVDRKRLDADVRAGKPVPGTARKEKTVIVCRGDS